MSQGQKTLNYRGFPTGGRRQGAQPLSPTERRELPYGKDTARGPLAGFKRLRATGRPGGQLCRPIVWLSWPMLAYIGLSCGQCGPILWLCWPMLASCMLTHVEPKDPKNGNSKKKHCKTQDILMVGGLSWGYVGPSWGYVGRS